ncbi:hypothetical protein IFM89_026347 [Coptis chinensis]|uniref:valine--tRNA ligase n=1 Tax=Coptis chinensis TaxID=261450 RepID=A0A835HQ30_9MAGN|nr:hypothetical protein IFM89_026347 [Coptis chinensis]
MVMLGMKLGGDIPFKKIYLHPMIRDAHGKKMSKSKGNVVDPLEVINGISLEGLQKWLEEGNLDPSELVDAKREQAVEFPDGIAECGADAMRFALVSYTAQSENINCNILRVIGYRQWCNKLWNVVRWILSVLNKAIFETVSSLDSYEFAKAANAVYLWWFQLCDTFIEVIKPYFSRADPKFDSSRSAACDTLWISLDSGLRLLHPFMPFVTEELWQRLPKSSGNYSKESIMISKYPSVTQKWTNNRIEYEMGLVEVIVKMLRSRRSQLSSDVTHESVLLCITDPKVYDRDVRKAQQSVKDPQIRKSSLRIGWRERYKETKLREVSGEEENDYISRQQFQDLRKLEQLYCDPVQRLVADCALMDMDTAVVSDRRGNITVLSCTTHLEGNKAFFALLNLNG